MGRKRNPVLPVFTRDILSSPRCRALSEAAAGIYFFLLCRLNEPPTPGAYRLSDWELHPNWKRSKTQQCLAEPDKYERLQYFASLLAKNDLPWKQKNILAGLQELYKYGIITVEGDYLIQPRMYKDNGFTMPDLDNDGDPEGTILDDPASGSMASKDAQEFNENKGAKNGTQKRTKKGTEKVQKKTPVIHAHAHSNEIEIENNNNIKDNNSKSIKEKGVGKTKYSAKQKTQSVPQEPVEPADNDVNLQDAEEVGGPTFDEFWELYDKRVNMSDAQNYWNILSRDDHEAIMQYLPRYKQAQPTKRFRKNPVTFLRMRAWQDEIISEREVAPAKPQKQGEAVPATAPKEGKYKKW